MLPNYWAPETHTAQNLKELKNIFNRSLRASDFSNLFKLGFECIDIIAGFDNQIHCVITDVT